MTLGLPFVHLNLRRNPFGELAPDDRAMLAQVDFDAYGQLLEKASYLLQFVAHSGRGKTTHLLALRARFGGRYILIPEEGPGPKMPRGPERVYVDETQRLRPRLRRKLIRACPRLVIGTHEDHSAEFVDAGCDFKSVTLSGMEPARLGSMLRARIQAARRGPGPVPELSEDLLLELIESWGDNVRAIEHALYIAVQKMETPGQVRI